MWLPEAFLGIDTPWNNFPKLKALMDKIWNHPNIKDWMEKRPQKNILYFVNWNNFPKLKPLMDKIWNHPNIKDGLEKRYQKIY